MTVSSMKFSGTAEFINQKAVCEKAWNLVQMHGDRGVWVRWGEKHVWNSDQRVKAESFILITSCLKSRQENSINIFCYGSLSL